MPGMVAISGALTVIALLFKHGKREDLIDYGINACTFMKKLFKKYCIEQLRIVIISIHFLFSN